MALASFVGRKVVLRRPAGAAHDDAFVLDELGRLRVAVLVALQAAARIALDVERLRIALLLVRAVLLAPLAPSPEHGSVVPVRRYTKPPPGAFV